jgi:hypothetical protein
MCVYSLASCCVDGRERKSHTARLHDDGGSREIKEKQRRLSRMECTGDENGGTRSPEDNSAEQHGGVHSNVQ